MSLLDVAYNLVQDYPGGAASLAPRINKNPTTLSHELNGTGTAKLGLLDAQKITKFSKNLRILQAWAMDEGQMLLPLPTEEGQTADDCLRRLGVTAKEFGELCAEVTTDLADSQVSDNELGRIERQCGDLIAALHGLMAAISKRNQESKPPHLRSVT